MHAPWCGRVCGDASGQVDHETCPSARAKNGDLNSPSGPDYRSSFDLAPFLDQRPGGSESLLYTSTLKRTAIHHPFPASPALMKIDDVFAYNVSMVNTASQQVLAGVPNIAHRQCSSSQQWWAAGSYVAPEPLPKLLPARSRRQGRSISSILLARGSRSSSLLLRWHSCGRPRRGLGLSNCSMLANCSLQASWVVRCNLDCDGACGSEGRRHLPPN